MWRQNEYEGDECVYLRMKYPQHCNCDMYSWDDMPCYENGYALCVKGQSQISFDLIDMLDDYDMMTILKKMQDKKV